MFRFAAPLIVAAGVLGFSSTAHAATLCNMVDPQAGPLQCTLDEDPTGVHNEYVNVSDSNADGWFEAWSFILDPGTDFLSTGDFSHVSDIVHIFGSTPGTVPISGGAEMWSDEWTGVFGANAAASFFDVFNFALAFDPSLGQVVGDPLFAGARNYGGNVGLTNEDVQGFAHLVDIAGVFGAGDSIDIISTADAGTTPEIPEPATLTLVGLGGLVAVLRRRRKTTV